MLLAALLFGFSLIAATPHADPSTDQHAALTLTGLVDSAMVDKVENFQGDQILIDSIGGSVMAGLRLADIISERKIRVTVIDRCYSACFSFVFLPAARREVRRGATLAMHPGEIETKLLAQDQGAPLAGKTRALASQHAEALARASVGMEVFRESIRLLRLELAPGAARCPASLLRPGDSGDDAMCQLATGRFRTWYPTTDQLKRFGIEVIGPPIAYRSLEAVHAKINIANRERPIVIGECEYFPLPSPVLNCPNN